MPHPPLFDVIKVTKELTTICSQFVEKQSPHIKLDWLKLDNGGRKDALGVKWRLRNTESGKYLDTYVSSVSREALVVLDSVGSKRRVPTSHVEAFSEAAREVFGVISYGLQVPAREWSGRGRRRKKPQEAAIAPPRATGRSRVTR